MNFTLSEELKALKKTCRKFAAREIAPRASEFDEKAEFPYEIVARMGEIGLLGLTFPEEYGGAGAGYLALAIALEEIACADISCAAVLGAQNSIGGGAFCMFGNEAQKRRWLPPMARGECIGALGLTEPNAGSDLRSIETSAVLAGGQWIINGTKCFISHAGTEISGFVNILAVTPSDNGGREFNLITVPKGTPGYLMGKKYKKLGWRATDTRELVFDDCRVPDDNLLGQRGRGLQQVMQLLDAGRVVMAAMSVGLANACLEASLRYALERKQFGRPIASFQAIQFKLADMATEIEAARLLTYQAAALKDSGRPFKKEATMAKLYASEVAVRAAVEAVQIHGGYGYVDEYPVGRYLRDAKLQTIGEGTSEVCRLLIARLLGCPSGS